MQLPDEKIKAAILHPESEVRQAALHYFTQSYCADTSIMPVVINAIEFYEWNDPFEILCAAADLPQTPGTVDWLITQLHRDFRTRDLDEDNLRYALAITLLRADPELLAPRHGQIISSPAFPEPLQRIRLIQPFEGIHTDLAVERILSFLPAVEEIDLRSALAFAGLGHFAPGTIKPARQVLLEADEEENGEYWDLRNRLIVAATILGESFPEYEAWHREAVATEYGLKKIKDLTVPFSLAESYDERPARELRRLKQRPRFVYQLRVTLKEIKPPVWRRLLVPDCKLDDLHEMIQIAMGWETYHLYSFKIGQTEYTHPEMDDGELNMEDSTAVSLSKLVVAEKQRLLYTYDFGDGWTHDILVEKISKPEPGQKQPVCLKGNRACPPEDVGGPGGYADYLEALADPEHEQHEEFLGWRGAFDSEAFEVDAVNRELRKAFH